MVGNESAMEISEQEFEETINNSYKLVVVDFFAEWCMPCLMLSPVIEEFADRMKDVKFVKINIDENESLAEKYKVSSVPTLVIFKEGSEIDRINGNILGEEIEKKINEYLD